MAVTSELRLVKSAVIQYGGMMVIMVALSIIPSSVFADEDSGFQESIISVFEWFNEMMTENIQNSNMKDSTKENLQSTLDTGTDAGSTGTVLWFKVHKFVVELIFAGTDETDLGVSKDLIAIIAMLVVFGGIFAMFLHMFRHNTKILVIVILTLLVLGILGVVIEF